MQSVKRFRKVVVGGWGQPYRFVSESIPPEAVVAEDPEQYRRYFERYLRGIGPVPPEKMRKQLRLKALLDIAGTGDVIYVGPRGGRYRYNKNGRKSYDV